MNLSRSRYRLNIKCTSAAFTPARRRRRRRRRRFRNRIVAYTPLLIPFVHTPFKISRAFSGQRVPGTDDPRAMAKVIQIEAERVLGFCHAAFEHSEHFGRVPAGAEDDEEVRGLLSMAAGRSEGFGPRGIEDAE